MRITDPGAALSSTHAEAFFKLVFSQSWDTTEEPPAPTQNRVRLDDSSIVVGTSKRDLPLTGKSPSVPPSWTARLHVCRRGSARQ